MEKSPPKPWTVDVFENQRPHLTTFVREKISRILNDTDCRRILVRAPVKSGKREMVEYIAMRDARGELHRIHVFISAWHRKADDEQRIELEQHNMKVFSINKRVVVDSCITWIRQQLTQQKHVVVHLDECDYASGETQLLSEIWTFVRDKDCITSILYSATPEEVLFSGEVDGEQHRSMIQEIICEGERVDYTPPIGYCGPAVFLENGLVSAATPFFEEEKGIYSLTDQGKLIVSDLNESMKLDTNRNVVVLRLSYSQLGDKVDKKDKKGNKSIYLFLNHLDCFPELKDWNIIVDKDESVKFNSNRIICERIQWSNPYYWKKMNGSSPYLMVIDQTSSRSTEWSCHDRIFAHHDFRNQIQYTTVSQSQERVNHYIQKYNNKIQPIKVYGCVRSFKLSAGHIDYETFLTVDYKKRKIRSRESIVELFSVENRDGVLQSECVQNGVSCKEADRLLQHLDCYADLSISLRVAGDTKESKVYEGEWYPIDSSITSEDWTKFAESHTIKHNPFKKSIVRTREFPREDGKMMGYHRGWGLLEYKDGILYKDGKKDSLKWGDDSTRTKVCYHNDHVGVLIVKDTGRTERVGSLRAHKSMYGN
jgi:hypothetical protein